VAESPKLALIPARNEKAGRVDMRAFAVAVVAAVLVAGGAAAVLNSMQKPADATFKTESVRLPDRTNS
jgi:hypothetical protein